MRCVAALVLCMALAGMARAQGLAERAAGGDPAAQFELGMKADLGDGVPADARVAFSWFQKAAKAGSPEAEFNLAVMLDSGRGVTRDLAEAALWYARSAAHGNHRAQFNLGMLYAAGNGLPRNPDIAAFWFRRASATIPAARRRLAALRSASRAGADTVTAATLAAPRGDTVSGLAAVEFVWMAPAQPEPARYLVEIRALDESGSLEVYSEATDGSATLASLRERPGHYAWRVLTLAPRAARYAVSDWVAFKISPPALDP